MYSDKKSLSHRTTETKFDRLRIEALERAQRQLPVIVQNRIKLKGLDFSTVTSANHWDLAWEKKYRQYKHTAPKRFELSIWDRHQLCGLSLGKPTWGGGKLRLDYIESAPDDHKLRGRITQITLDAAEAYADMIGATQLRITNPINDRVRDHYCSGQFGFKYDPMRNLCWRDL